MSKEAAWRGFAALGSVGCVVGISVVLPCYLEMMWRGGVCSGRMCLTWRVITRKTLLAE